MAIDDIAYGGFDDMIGAEANEGGGFTVIAPGTYAFTIEKPVGREQFGGSDKMPPCWKANVELKVDALEQGTVTVPVNFFLTKKQSWKIKQFFVSLGLVDANAEQFVAPWNRIAGASGVVEIGNRTYNGNVYNDAKKYLPPAEGAEAVAKTMQEHAAAQPTQGQLFTPPPAQPAQQPGNFVPASGNMTANGGFNFPGAGA